LLNGILIQAIPKKKINTERSFLVEIPAFIKRIYPTNRLNKDHKTFIVGDESPFPGGLAKGVGNLSPEIPLTKCGTKLARNMPDQKPIK